MTDLICQICGRTSDETCFLPSETYHYPTQHRCRDCRRERNFRLKHPTGKRCVCCGIPKGRDDFLDAGGRVMQRCTDCAAKPALRNPLMPVTCAACGMTKRARDFNNDHLQPSGKNDHCRPCRNKAGQKARDRVAAQSSGFEDDPRAASADLHGRISRVASSDHLGTAGSSAAQAMDDMDALDGRTL